MAVDCMQVFVNIMLSPEPVPPPVIISPPTPPVIVIPPLPPAPILIDGISTTDPGLANQQIIAYYQARVPSCDRWGYIHSTIEQKVKDWGTLRWGWDAGALESTLRANIPDNPCYVSPPPVYVPPSSMPAPIRAWVYDSTTGGAYLNCDPNKRILFSDYNNALLNDPYNYSFIC